METQRDPDEHLAMIRAAWDAYQPAYMEFHLKERPDFFEHLSSGGTYLSDYERRLAGDVSGKTVLDVCCAGAADEAFSWENLGANVVACDVSPVAIEIATRNAERLGSRVRFFVADAQELAPIESESIDLVYGRYLCWFEDLDRTFRAWFRPAVEFFHPTWRVINAALNAGFRLIRVEEPLPRAWAGEGQKHMLPRSLVILAEKGRAQ